MTKKEKNIDIKVLCYDLYKADWERRISAQTRAASIVEYHEDIASGDFEGNYEDWLFENGYGGQIYVCFDEFLDIEFLDADYIEALLEGFDASCYLELYHESLDEAELDMEEKGEIE